MTMSYQFTDPSFIVEEKTLRETAASRERPRSTSDTSESGAEADSFDSRSDTDSLRSSANSRSQTPVSRSPSLSPSLRSRNNCSSPVFDDPSVDAGFHGVDANLLQFIDLSELDDCLSMAKKAFKDSLKNHFEGNFKAELKLLQEAFNLFSFADSLQKKLPKKGKALDLVQTKYMANLSKGEQTLLGITNGDYSKPLKTISRLIRVAQISIKWDTDPSTAEKKKELENLDSMLKTPHFRRNRQAGSALSATSVSASASASVSVSVSARSNPVDSHEETVDAAPTRSTPASHRAPTNSNYIPPNYNHPNAGPMPHAGPHPGFYPQYTGHSGHFVQQPHVQPHIQNGVVPQQQHYHQYQVLPQPQQQQQHLQQQQQFSHHHPHAFHNHGFARGYFPSAGHYGPHGHHNQSMHPQYTHPHPQMRGQGWGRGMVVQQGRGQEFYTAPNGYRFSGGYRG